MIFFRPVSGRLLSDTIRCPGKRYADIPNAKQTISSHTAVNVHCIINYSTFCTLCCSRKDPYLPNGKFLLSRELGRETCLKMSRRGKASRCMFVQGVTVHFIKSHCCLMYVLGGKSQISVECLKRGSGGIFNFLHTRVIDLF